MWQLHFFIGKNDTEPARIVKFSDQVAMYNALIAESKKAFFEKGCKFIQVVHAQEAKHV